MSPRKKNSGAVHTVNAMNDKKEPRNDRAAQKGARTSKPGLTRDAIVAAAMAIIDREGYESLSMRRLGKELGVDPMAVYYHIPNKSALLDALVEVVMNEIDPAIDDPSRSIEERLATAAHVYRDAILSHPSLIPTVIQRPPRTLASLRPVEALLGIFLDAGFAPVDALAAVNIFAAYVRGSVIREVPYRFDLAVSEFAADVADYSQVAEMLTPEEFPNLVEAVKGGQGFIGFDEEFDRGSRALMRGLLKTYGKKGEVD